jgi:ribonucleoside-diphosphate reductase alpha chain
MWKNREYYNGLSVLPYNGGTYVQPPFEDCSEEEYKKMFSFLQEVDLSNVIEEKDETNLSGELACAGGVCEIN